MKPAKTKSANAKDDDTPMSDPKPPRGFLVLKTYDPISGVTLKYRTTKAAEVSRLIHALGRLGRVMAALPEEASPAGRDEDMADVPGKEAEGASTPVEGGKGEGKGDGKPGATSSRQAQGGGGGGKKKKGKK